MARWRKVLFQKKTVFLILLLVFASLEAAILSFTPPSFSRGSGSAATETSLQNYADIILEKCSSYRYRQGCYDNQIPKLMDIFSMEETFQVAKLITDKDPDYLHCHVLGHRIAEQEVGKDISKWKDVVARCPATMCNNGCPHGAVMARFQNESEELSEEQAAYVKNELKSVCEPRGSWHPVEVEKSMCYHSLGHLGMYITAADIPKSIKVCEEIGIKANGNRNYADTCIEGVFMSVFQPLDPEDFALVEGLTPLREEVDSFCGPYAGEAFHACHREAWTLFRRELVMPEGLTRFCSYTQDMEAQEHCYASLMNFIALVYVHDEENLDDLKDFCTGLLPDWVGFCFEHAARRLMQVDPRYAKRAVEVCGEADGVGVGEQCYERLLYYAQRGFHPASEEVAQYCKNLPDPWEEKCLIRGKVLPDAL